MRWTAYFLLACWPIFARGKTTEDIAREYLHNLNDELAKEHDEYSMAYWTTQANATKENVDAFNTFCADCAARTRKKWDEYNKFQWKKFAEGSVQRQFKFLCDLQEMALPTERYNQLQALMDDMELDYTLQKIPSFDKKKNLTIDGVLEVMKTSNNPKELEHVWVEWHNALGDKVKPKFVATLKYLDEAANLNNFRNPVDMWFEPYETPKLKDTVRSLWSQVKPLYLELHAYVRHCLRRKYGDVVSQKGPIPIHLLGGMWSKTWVFLRDINLPYPDRPGEVDLFTTDTGPALFKYAENFVLSLGMPSMPKTFWSKSIFEKPDSPPVLCMPQTMSISAKNDHRAIFCSYPPGKSYYLTAHALLGMIEYAIAYKMQPQIYQRAANPAFEQAVGQALSLSCRSAKHIQKVKLSEDYEVPPEEALNTLFATGLDEIPSLAFSYHLMTWRWGVFTGETKMSHINCKWWESIQKWQGVEPAVNRTEEQFDAGSKPNMLANRPYISYFLSIILQYQLHRALCVDAGKYIPAKPRQKPLHECDLTGCRRAGDRLVKMMELGRSKHWSESLEIVTGEKVFNAAPFMEYYRPLFEWLQNKNKETGAYVGWKSTKTCV